MLNNAFQFLGLRRPSGRNSSFRVSFRQCTVNALNEQDQVLYWPVGHLYPIRASRHRFVVPAKIIDFVGQTMSDRALDANYRELPPLRSNSNSGKGR